MDDVRDPLERAISVFRIIELAIEHGDWNLARQWMPVFNRSVRRLAGDDRKMAHSIARPLAAAIQSDKPVAVRLLLSEFRKSVCGRAAT
jgi:hypothetical protein